jgi:hypothetical protein
MAMHNSFTRVEISFSGSNPKQCRRSINADTQVDKYLFMSHHARDQNQAHMSIVLIVTIDQ